MPNIMRVGGGSGGGNTIVVTVDSGATVTATNGSKTVSGVSVNGTCTLKVPEVGTWTVTATKDGMEASATVTVTDSFAQTLVFASSVLENNSWATIKNITDTGNGANFWSVGDRKKIFLNGYVRGTTYTDKELYVFIAGFDHNSALEGTGITFQGFMDADGKRIALCDAQYMNTAGSYWLAMNQTQTTDAGWEGCQFRANAVPELLAALPSDLQAVIRTTVKYTNNTGADNTVSAVTATNDSIYLPAEFEVNGAWYTANRYEQEKQAQLEYYRLGNSKIAYVSTNTDNAAVYWTRSADRANSKFIAVAGNGTLGTSDSRFSLGICPCFCVGGAAA